MYFVVYSEQMKDFAVVPNEWIQDLQFERIVNYFFKQRRYRCYGGTDVDAWTNGIFLNNGLFF